MMFKIFVLCIFLFSGTIYSSQRTDKGNAYNLRSRTIEIIENRDTISVGKYDKSGNKKEALIYDLLNQNRKNNISQISSKEKQKKEPYESCCGYIFRDKHDFIRHRKTMKHRANQKKFQNIINEARKIASTIPQIFPEEIITNDSIREIILDPEKRFQLQNYFKENKTLLNNNYY